MNIGVMMMENTELRKVEIQTNRQIETERTRGLSDDMPKIVEREFVNAGGEGMTWGKETER